MEFRWNGNALNWLLRIVVVAALILAALGSGNPATVEPLPDWINTGSNLLCLLIAAAVLFPRLEIWAALATMAMMVASMVTNYAVDGPAYFWRVLPFNLVTLMTAFLLLLRLRRGQV